jgi:hypothetical protein
MKLHTCACKNEEKNGPFGGSWTEEERRPFKNSEACEPVTDKTDLFKTGAAVGTCLSNVPSTGASIVMIVLIT